MKDAGVVHEEAEERGRGHHGEELAEHLGQHEGHLLVPRLHAPQDGQVAEHSHRARGDEAREEDQHEQEEVPVTVAPVRWQTLALGYLGGAAIAELRGTLAVLKTLFQVGTVGLRGRAARLARAAEHVGVILAADDVDIAAGRVAGVARVADAEGVGELKIRAADEGQG